MHTMKKFYTVLCILSMLYSFGYCSDDDENYCVCYCNGVLKDSHRSLSQGASCNSQTCKQACSTSCDYSLTSGICVKPDNTGTECVCDCCADSDTCTPTQQGSFPTYCDNWQCDLQCNEMYPVCKSAFFYGHGQLNNRCIGGNSRAAAVHHLHYFYIITACFAALVPIYFI